MTEQEASTKERILLVASKMFASNGFNGTSIRDIAAEADVNLSAVNYHFKNKQSLYEEVFKSHHNWLVEEIEKIGNDDSLQSQEFVWQVYSFFKKNGDSVTNTFKIFIEGDVDLPQVNESPTCFGPPGQEIFIQKFKQDLGDDIPDEGFRWAVRMIFSNLVHWAVMENSPCIKKQADLVPHFHPDEKKKTIYFLVEAILEYLKKHSDNWKN